jgi:subtilase family serine protease
MKGSIRLAAGGAGVLALALTTAATASAGALLPGVHQHTQAEAKIEAHAFTSPVTVHQCLKLFGVRCYNPAQLRAAYDLAPLYAAGNDGSGTTIAIVDSFGSPTIQSDLHTFDQTFGLPDPELQVIAPAGAIPPFDPTNPDHVGWAQESTLDVEAAHLIAPGAKILLVETPVAETEGITGFPEIVQAENYVIDNHLADVITQSFGATEQTFASPDELLAQRSAFMNAAANGITVLASTGDTGSANYTLDGDSFFPFPAVGWPASDPLVTAIGGTQLFLNNDGSRIKPDTVWADAYGAGGGGLSAVFPRPDYQSGLDIRGTGRAIPDISMSAAVNGGIVVYYTFQPGREGFHIFGGTSEASPLFAGIVALAAQRAGHSLGLINPALYALQGSASSGIVDVVHRNITVGFVDPSGNPVIVKGWRANKGYDLASGLGTVDAAQFVPALASAAAAGE